MIAVQFAHALEEFVFEFWNAFPPMLSIFDGAWGVGVFVLFHAVLIGFGWWCVREVRRGGLVARDALTAWIIIQAVTIAVHVAWLTVDWRYQPGLATTPLLIATTVLGIQQLVRERGK
jgi:hypothetical protein